MFGLDCDYSGNLRTNSTNNNVSSDANCSLVCRNPELDCESFYIHYNYRNEYKIYFFCENIR